jgi:predicted naringenin-chalcone synthase
MTNIEKNVTRPVYIHQIEILLPEHAYSQDAIRDTMLSWVEGEDRRLVITTACQESGIATRHSVLGDFGGRRTEGIFFKGDDGKLHEAGTRERNNCYCIESRRMSVEVARRVLAKCAGVSARDITHVIFVSSTGFCNPGADYYIVRELGLKQTTARFVLGFMGCYGSISALRMAREFCAADPSAVVLVVSVEICTLHLHFRGDMKSLLASALYSDGAAAVIVSTEKPERGSLALRMDQFTSAIMPEGEKEMTWHIGDDGFDIGVSTRSSEIIGSNILAIIVTFLGRNGLAAWDINHWAVHPGGRKLLDTVEQQLDIKAERISASREVLSKCGNMSSASLFFVLKELEEQLKKSKRKNRNICAMAFGPGLTLEAALLST